MKGNKRCSRAICLGVVILFYFGCCSLGSGGGFAPPQSSLGAAKQKKKHDEPPPPSAMSMSPSIARLTLMETLPKGFAFKGRAPIFGGYTLRKMTGVQFRPDGLVISVESGDQIDLLFDEVPRYGKVRAGNVELSLQSVGSLIWQGPDSGELARRAGDALNRLLYDAWQGHPAVDADLEAFRQKATAWRALQKPQESEEVYKERLLAEDALKGKQIVAALQHYEAGVQADPTWAQGWFNAALLYAELGDYIDAVDHMNRYLILLPDAPDAKAAKDNVILWEAKAKKVMQ